ncbi:VOC family protein [Pseudoduganella lutea]|uniref:Glyoxalase n=1 Tax=Pseudoduganella lutea TaxID=321985 RepID=A0A4P6KXB3_9BURK|nr:VOC family protein [Pseudoduganella lutea]QBE62888.1 glyoxalase [Pseudoduganella lutea]
MTTQHASGPHAVPKHTRATIMPCLRYRDAPAAIEWLCSNLGFEATLVVRNEDGTVAHAQLSYGNGMIMLGSIFDTDYGRLLKQPVETGKYVTQSSYLVVNDADRVHERVMDAGGEVVLPLQDEDYGGRGFTCRDPEGHVWSIGTYDPWAEAERPR